MTDKEKNFDKTSDNFKKICTENGIDTDALVEFINNAIKLIPDEEKMDFASYLIITVMIECSCNIFEGLGILEIAKQNFLNATINDNMGDNEDFEVE